MRHATETSRRGFSLVEVLIAILVLAIGLLGLAAVFPAVIAQQREANDRTTGGLAAEQVAARVNLDTDQLPMAELRKVIPTAGTEPRWEESWSTQNQYVNDGRFRGNGASTRIDLPVSARLLPEPNGTSEPQYVWDLAVRTAPGEAAKVAVFVRRIDAGIRVPRGYSLSDIFAGRVPGQSGDLLPVGVDPATKRPTGNGTGEYAVPRVERVSVRWPPGFDSGQRVTGLGWLSIPASADVAVSESLSRAGQQIVDEDGLVRTLRGVDSTINDNGRVWIRVEPAFEREDTDHWIVFTPQVPASVSVVTLEN